jgi:hypothetical protein
MIYTITQQPHPLDAIWEAAAEAWSDATAAMDALGSDFEDSELDAAGQKVTEALHVLLSLPARNVADSIYKLYASGIEQSGGARTDCDVSAIMNEALDLLDEATARGRALEQAAKDLTA